MDSQDKKTFAVTGATGFIGRNLIRRLHRAGHQLKLLVRNPARAQGPEFDSAQLIQGDLNDQEALEALLDGADAVAHCAGAVRGATLHQFTQINEQGARQLAYIASQQAAPPRFLALSSLAAREPQLSHYAHSKYLGEQALQETAGDLLWCALRPPAVYGPGDKEMRPLFQAMAKGIAPLITAADARFSLLHVEDLAAAMQCWLESPRPPQGIFELHDGKSGGYDFSAVAETVASITGRSVRIINIPSGLLTPIAHLNALAGRLFPRRRPMLTPGKLRELGHRNWVCNNAEIQQQLDWQPRYQLMDGLEHTPGWKK